MDCYATLNAREKRPFYKARAAERGLPILRPGLSLRFALPIDEFELTGQIFRLQILDEARRELRLRQKKASKAKQPVQGTPPTTES